MRAQILPDTISPTLDRRFVAISARTERLVGGEDTAANRADHDPWVAAWVARHDQVAVMSQLVVARIPTAPINVEPWLRDSDVAARERIVQFDDEALGPLVPVQPSSKLSRTPSTIRSLGPAQAA